MLNKLCKCIERFLDFMHGLKTHGSTNAQAMGAIKICQNRSCGCKVSSNLSDTLSMNKSDIGHFLKPTDRSSIENVNQWLSATLKSE